MSTETIRIADIKVGDVIKHTCHWITVTAIEPVGRKLRFRGTYGTSGWPTWFERMPYRFDEPVTVRTDPAGARL